MDRSYFKYIFIIVVIVIIGFAVYKFSTNETEEQQGVVDQTSTVNTIQKDLRFAIAGLDSMNPIISKNRNVQEISKIIFDPLVTLNENYKLDLRLAESIEKINDTTYVVKVRPGVLWSNGANFTAYDVQYTIDIIKDENVSSIYKENLKYVASVSVKDDTTLELHLTQRVPFFEYYLTFPIVCRSYHIDAGIYNAEKNEMPVSTGMFSFESKNGNVYTLKRNDTYWDKNRVPMVEEVIVTTYQTIGEVYNSFKSGGLDLVTVNTSNVEEYIGTLGYNKVEYKARNYDFLSINVQSEVFEDKLVRQAVSLALDKNAIVASCLGNGYAASNFSLDYGEWLYTKDLTVNTDTEKAKELLEEAGWSYRNNNWQKRGITGRTETLDIVITVNSDNEERVRVAENIGQQLENIGINVGIRELNTNKFNQAMNVTDYECAIVGIEVGFSPSLQTFFGDGNIANYYSVDMKSLLKAAEDATDEKTMYDCYNKIFDIYLEDCPYIGLYRNTQSIIMNTGLVGNISPNSFNNFCNIYQWYRQ